VGYTIAILRGTDKAEKTIEKATLDDVRSCLAKKDGVIWVDAAEPSFAELTELAGVFGFHPLAVEDAHLRHQRPKIDQYENFIFLVFYAIALVDDRVMTEEVEFFVGDGYVVTAHIRPLRAIVDVKTRWMSAVNIGGLSSGMLLYSLLDAIVDAYFPLIDQLGEHIEELEESIFNHESPTAQREIFHLKRNLASVRRLLGPERDVMNILVRRDVPLFDNTTAVYLTDVYDHILRVNDALDSYREVVTGALDAYLSLTSNRLNQVLKRMTAATIILMSVTLVASIYGMNFVHMPELAWQYGYPLALSTMLLIAGGLGYFFKRIDYL
jgi:magnesium transporter